MAYNFINEASQIIVSPLCYHDNVEGYASDLSVNGEFDGWDYYTGIHTYGCWGGFLFGTFWNTEGYIGRHEVFTPVPAETHYYVKIAMKYNPTDNSSASQGRLMWRTLSNPSWDSTKQIDFSIQADNQWHIYTINVGNAQWWQGDVNDMRIYPSINARAGDEFFIKYIKIVSTDTYRCTNGDCSYYQDYEHNCPGVGEKGTCTSSVPSDYFTVSGTLIVNINGYGSENVKLDSLVDAKGLVVAREMANAISRLDIGGYAEVEVIYNEDKTLSIYSGTYGSDSTVVVEDSEVARALGFIDSVGNDISVKTTGTASATGYIPRCSYLLKSHQLYDVFDTNKDTSFRFDPKLYSVEGGRRDILENGPGSAVISSSSTGINTSDYTQISNYGKTLVDLSNPFNSSGRITKIEAACTLDTDSGVVTGCKFKIFRPSRDGTYRYITSVNIPDRENGGSLQSITQEYVSVGCNIVVNKGDVLGIYNADVYVGKQRGDDVDAKYFQVDGDITSDISNYFVVGDGVSGFSMYARGDQKQNRITLDVDLGHRYNISTVTVEGEVTSDYLEYNIVRCKDVNWTTDAFGLSHTSGYFDVWNSVGRSFSHPNVAYGTSKLSDGIYVVENNLAADGYAVQEADGQAGVIPDNPQYFFFNGDGEWVGTLMHVGQYKADPHIENFKDDPIAIYVEFPYQMEKAIYKSKIYFKEFNNFRSFALSYLSDPTGIYGNADDKQYTYIPDYTAVTLNGLRYHEDMDLYDQVSSYLFSNPCSGKDETIRPSPVTEGSVSTVINGDEHAAAVLCDWTIIEHEWDPIDCMGFRVYCDYHNSTKITEMELYCRTEDVGSSLAGSVGVLFSSYEENWTSAYISQSGQYSAEALIADTPRYLIVDIEPITEVRLENILFDVDVEAGHVGEKGCEYDIYSNEAKRDNVNAPQTISLKNVYGRSYNLYVDIAKESLKEEGLIFHSRLNDADSVSNPVVGADAEYKKEATDYEFTGKQNNCAINCYTYGLGNLIDGAYTYVSNDNGQNIAFNAVVSGTDSMDIENVPDGNLTTVVLPVLYRERYWRISVPWDALDISVREVQIFDENDVQLRNYTWNYDTGTETTTPAAGDAPHVENSSVIGSYYNVSSGEFLTVDLESSKIIKEIRMYHDATTTYTETVDQAGIDPYAKIVIHGDAIEDAGCFQHPLTNIGGVTTTVTSGSFSSEALYFNGNSYLTAPSSSDWQYIASYYNDGVWEFDFRVKFNSLPAVGEYVYFIMAGDFSNGEDNWSFYLYNDGGTYKLNVRFYTRHWFNVAWTPNLNQWYHIRSAQTGASVYNLLVDGVSIAGFSTGAYEALRNYDLYIGKNLDGYMEEVRTSKGLARNHAPFTVIYKPFLQMDVYTSPDNMIYGIHSENNMYISPNSFSQNFYTYFYIDLLNRHALDFIRSYGASDAHSFSKVLNMDMSEDKLSDPNSVNFDIGAGVERTGRQYHWGGNAYYESDTESLIFDGSGDYICFAMGDGTDSYLADNDFTIDVWVKFDTIGTTQTVIQQSRHTGNYWYLRMTANGLEAYFRNAFSFGQTTPGTAGWTTDWHHIALTRNGTQIRMYRDGVIIGQESYSGLIPLMVDPKWNNDHTDVDYYSNLHLGTGWSNSSYIGGGFASYIAINSLDGQIAKARILNGVALWTSSFEPPDKDISWSADSYTVFLMDVLNDLSQVRWVRIKMLNGDGTDRVIRKIGIYPDITMPWVDGGYNCTWHSLGNSVTNYGTGDNSALNKEVTSSSEFAFGYASRITDGFLGDDFSSAWLSERETHPWVYIDLGSEQDIYRVKVYSGLDDSNTNYLVTDYDIAISDDALSWTTIFSITSNAELERTHDLSTPVTARYIRMYINGYNNDPIYMHKGDGEYGYFKGACLREIEVYADYGFQIISSEDYPVIITNLRDQFYISGYSIVGEDAEDTSDDWTGSSSDVAYSDAVTSNPNLVIFDSWGTSPLYEQWIAVKETAATEYESGPKYLKHLVVESAVELKPCEHNWWWRSSLSNLERDHIYVQEAYRSLRIEYPSSSGIDDVSFIEGDYFGIDEYAGVRDGIAFWLYISDIDKLDTSYGYFYFGNEDTPVVYKWNISTYYDGGALDTGWNYIFLRFKGYDDIEYTASSDPAATDVRVPDTINWKTMGINFRGKGQAFNMVWEGFKIEKNHFNDACYANLGLYLVQRDFLTANIGELSLDRGTIEFFMRPDYNSSGRGYFNVYKQRNLFVLSNLAQDFIGAFVYEDKIISYFGNLNDNFTYFETAIDGYWERDEVVHLAFNWSNNGTAIDTDGSTMRVYVYGLLQSKVYDTWEVNENSKVSFSLGGKAPFAVTQHYSSEISSIDAVISELKLHNYCKKDFDAAIDNVYLNENNITKPSQLIEISKDNLTYYKVGATALPLVWEDVAANTTIPLYVRTVLPRSLTGKELRTAGIIVSWDVGV